MDRFIRQACQPIAFTSSGKLATPAQLENAHFRAEPVYRTSSGKPASPAQIEAYHQRREAARSTEHFGPVKT